MLSTLPSPSSISSLSQEQQYQVLDTLFEPSPELHAITGPVLTAHSFASYASLADAVRGQLSALSLSQLPADRQTLMKILGSHPRLGRPPAKATEQLSELSRKEQANLNTSAAENQIERLNLLNQEYEGKFPGLRFVYVEVGFPDMSDANDIPMQNVCKWPKSGCDHGRDAPED
jgi:2-oxo-4-hydroxy-4-carboxy--5-ureidoimidazoline (OHCU) decarboxylase